MLLIATTHPCASFIERFNPDGKWKNIIFVDDSIKNVHACEPVGMRGILYKSAAQLEDFLRDFGITPVPAENLPE